MPPAARLLRVAADTNVLFSALAFFQESPPARVLELARSGAISLFLSPFILQELEELLRRKISWEEPALLALRRRLAGLARMIEPRGRLQVNKRVEADNRILECAVAATAHVLVTGNLKDLRPLGTFRGIAILTPREFLDAYFPAA
jgi:putative PIN family toxin of toxin-antitoxin system